MCPVIVWTGALQNVIWDSFDCFMKICSEMHYTESNHNNVWILFDVRYLFEELANIYLYLNDHSKFCYLISHVNKLEYLMQGYRTTFVFDNRINQWELIK